MAPLNTPRYPPGVRPILTSPPSPRSTSLSWLPGSVDGELGGALGGRLIHTRRRGKGDAKPKAEWGIFFSDSPSLTIYEEDPACGLGARYRSMAERPKQPFLAELSVGAVANGGAPMAFVALEIILPAVFNAKAPYTLWLRIVTTSARRASADSCQTPAVASVQGGIQLAISVPQPRHSTVSQVPTPNTTHQPLTRHTGTEGPRPATMQLDLQPQRSRCAPMMNVTIPMCASIASVILEGRDLEPARVLEALSFIVRAERDWYQIPADGRKGHDRPLLGEAARRQLVKMLGGQLVLVEELPDELDEDCQSCASSLTQGYARRMRNAPSQSANGHGKRNSEPYAPGFVRSSARTRGCQVRVGGPMNIITPLASFLGLRDVHQFSACGRGGVCDIVRYAEVNFGPRLLPKPPTEHQHLQDTARAFCFDHRHPIAAAGLASKAMSAIEYMVKLGSHAVAGQPVPAILPNIADRLQRRPIRYDKYLTGATSSAFDPARRSRVATWHPAMLRKEKIAQQNALLSWMSNSTVTGESFSGTVATVTAAIKREVAEDAAAGKAEDGNTSAHIDDNFAKLKAEQEAELAIVVDDDEDDEFGSEEDGEDEFEDVPPTGNNSGLGTPWLVGLKREASDGISSEQDSAEERMSKRVKAGTGDSKAGDEDDEGDGAEDEEELEFEDV
ncbi:hypothetical protein Purlil1_14062 [Purpureocillium lilacinum]|uniref:Uncharacterized protein n=1 Tax=Purpureocillium lilacinum TaxID=33203 RepID=A0ABR0BCC4_PURLI|nr:hypothetical protein Purlil1_14062 [Purpureocillium lilacinum]